MTEPSDLRLKFDWQPADDTVASPELRATFARLEIAVDQECVTLVGDAATGSVRRSIVVSLYPFAEWIVFNWWRLQYDGRSATTGSVGRHSHSTKFIGDGFCWPDLRVAPEGEICRMHWRKQRWMNMGWPIEYLAEGWAWGRREQVIGAFDDLVESVLGRLEESGIRDTVLAREWEALRSLDAEEAQFCRAVARLGVDPLGDGVGLADAVAQALDALGDLLGLELLDAASVPELGDDVAWLKTVIGDLAAPPLQSKLGEVLPEVSHAVSAAAQRTAGRPPWVVGWEAARSARSRLGLAPTDAVPDELSPTSSVRDLADHGLLAAGQGAALVTSWSMGELSRRFVNSRALFHAATVPVNQPFLLTRAASERQAAGRAFAAELLVPRAGLLALGAGETSDDDVARIGDHYRASDQIVRHQIENQHSLV